MNRQRVEQEIKRFSCRPRNCDWCEKRGLKIDPLYPVLVERVDMESGRFWVHRECADDMKYAENYVLGVELVVPEPE